MRSASSFFVMRGAACALLGSYRLPALDILRGPAIDLNTSGLHVGLAQEEYPRGRVVTSSVHVARNDRHTSLICIGLRRRTLPEAIRCTTLYT
ncbi:hypothetical protein DE146DRAFT_471069 [Phaeosphaeria sp. MPI-PUGE-AT-0046c]|nr:hypothetical protein DE146DRAFT_471069 [Phaeosphaeria sp. MPI-PUGE-AT-0046c]